MAQAVLLTVDTMLRLGESQCWRVCLGHGGINPDPLTREQIRAVARLKPRLIRVFVQEFFDIYPDHKRYRWQTLDRFLDSFRQTGANVVASITIKPRVLYPVIDQHIVHPTNYDEWGELIYRLVSRYTVEKRIVTHWEVFNEPDLGEGGGCPSLFEPADYLRYYEHTVKAIRRASPTAKVGGPAVSGWAGKEPLPTLAEWCHAKQFPLDFLSWHHYGDDPGFHAVSARRSRATARNLPTLRDCELFVTEWNDAHGKLDPETSQSPRRAAFVASAAQKMLEAGLSYSFYYQIADQLFRREQWESFFSPEGIAMMEPLFGACASRCYGLFSTHGEIRPEYYVFEMLSRVRGVELYVRGGTNGTGGVAVLEDETVRLVVWSYWPDDVQGVDVTLQIAVKGLSASSYSVTCSSIDSSSQWQTRTPGLSSRCSQVEVERGSILLDADLEANSVAFIELVPQA